MVCCRPAEQVGIFRTCTLDILYLFDLWEIVITGWVSFELLCGTGGSEVRGHVRSFPLDELTEKCG